MKIIVQTPRVFVFFTLILFISAFSSIPEEGMYPLSDIPKDALVDAGLKINPDEIYNPNGISLIDALVNIGGCTGSFVSKDGLIITNHHCAFRAVNNASTPEHNYLEDGFLAKDRSEEIPSPGYTVRITESYKDVSEIILSAVEGISDVKERGRIISEKIKELEEEASDEENSITAQVSEMFVGKTYILFKYRIIRDVRLVYAPPRSIGEFGGETDNWIWPRHTGDFSFMRAYVAPDGSAAEYSEENVPYTPKKYLKVNADGVDEGDFVFILGYPGRTFRHRPSQFIEYQMNYQLPFISNLYDWMIKKYESMSEGNVELELKYASTIKGLANVMKNYKGKLIGLKRTNLLEKKKAEESELQKFIDSHPELNEKYGDLLKEIDLNYNELFKIAEADLWFGRLFRFSSILSASDFIIDYVNHVEKEENYKDSESFQKDFNRIKFMLNNLNDEFERDFLLKMFDIANGFSSTSKIDALEGIEPEYFVENILMKAKFTDQEYFKNLFEQNAGNLINDSDSLLQFVQSLKSQRSEVSEKSRLLNAKLNELLTELNEVKRLWRKTNFIPDANRTLRLTYGYIKGYTPADAVYYKPITTLDGVIDKSYLGGEYKIPPKLKELYDAQDFGRFYDKDVNGLPVCILYNMDTTGGNSGSPIMNAYGELIGVNFDRAFEATINDFAWNESYSRSIGVDIRYVLWIMSKFSGADNLLEEMGVQL